jgi:hypothetical protein
VLEILDMTGMEHVESSGGKTDALAGVTLLAA